MAVLAVPPRSQLLPRIDMTRISTISTVLLVLAGLAGILPGAAAGVAQEAGVHKVGSLPDSMVSADFKHDGSLEGRSENGDNWPCNDSRAR